jgi:hypothetical protein
MGVLEIELQATGRFIPDGADDFARPSFTLNNERQLLAIIEGGNSICHQKHGIAGLKRKGDPFPID